MRQCSGLVTRKRITKTTVEESIIDFVIMSEDLSHDLESIVIDYQRQHLLTHVEKKTASPVRVQIYFLPLPLSLLAPSSPSKRHRSTSPSPPACKGWG